MSTTFLSIFFLIHTTLATSTIQLAPDALASHYDLPSTTSLPFPTAALSSDNTENFLVSKWSLAKGRIQDGPRNLAFVNDPFPNKPPSGAQGVLSPSGPVLQVTYPEGSFSHDTGGAQFYSLWNTTGNPFRTMMVSYELAFDSNFEWVKGGKLPGLRGGLNSTGCSGGNQADGMSCFSTRLMWRRDGAGEVYAYIPNTSKSLCSQKSVICNSDYGVSIQRGEYNFSMASERWMRLTLLVQLNDPPTSDNGHIQLFINDALVISQSNLLIRAADSVAANGFYFSTFFGGSDSSWATPVTTSTYFRNIRLWGSSKDAANLASDTTPNEGGPSLLRTSSIKIALSLLMCITGILYL